MTTNIFAREFLECLSGHKPRDHVSAELADELVQVLGEAATELWNIDQQHVTLARLRAVRRRVEEARA